MSDRIRIFFAIGVFISGFFKHNGYVPGNNLAIMVAHIFSCFRPVQMRRLVEVTSQNNDTACRLVFFRFFDETGDSIVTHGCTVQYQDRVQIRNRFYFFPIVTVISTGIVVSTIAVIQMGSVYGKFLVPFFRYQAINASPVVVQRINSTAVVDGIAA